MKSSGGTKLDPLNRHRIDYQAGSRNGLEHLPMPSLLFQSHEDRQENVINFHMR